MEECDTCGITYRMYGSSATLRMRFCSTTCEKNEFGYILDELATILGEIKEQVN